MSYADKVRRTRFTESGGTQYNTNELVGNRVAQRSFLSAFKGSERVRARRAINQAERLAAFQRATTHDD